MTSNTRNDYISSGCVYGYRKIYKDLLAAGEFCGKNRVHRLMKSTDIASQRGYKRRNQFPAGEVSTVAPNLLDREFNVIQPNKVWGTDIIYIRTYEGWLFLAVVIDQFSQQVVGWSMSKSINTDLVLDALTMAVWHRKPSSEVIVHSDQGCQYTSYDWRLMLEANGLVASMNRKGNCHDNACAKSFFSLLKRERVRRKVYSTREAAKSDIFNYIEMFYNSVRRHGYNDDLSPMEFENNYFKKLASV